MGSNSVENELLEKQLEEKNEELKNAHKLIREAFEVFHYRGFPHNHPTWEEWVVEKNIKIKLI